MTLAIGHGPVSATIYALFGTLVVVVTISATGAIATLRDRTGGPPPEGHPLRMYSHATVEEYLRKAGDGGRALYRRSLLQDFPFLLLYGAGLVLLIDGTLGRVFANPSALLRSGLPAVGAAAAAADALEDLCLLLAMRKAEASRPSWVRVASIFTLMKWLAVMASIAAIGTGAILLAFRGLSSL